MKNVRRTNKGKERIFEVISNSDIPLTVYQLSELTAIPVPTVYRNIGILEIEKKIKSFTLEGVNYFYEFGKHMHYFKCEVCGKFVPIKTCDVHEENIEKLIEGKVKEHLVMFFGICKSCLKEGKV